MCLPQSHPEAQRLPVREQRPARLLHPRRELRGRGGPAGARQRAARLRAPRRAPRRLTELRYAPQAAARRHPPAAAGAHAVRRRHHRQGGGHHPQHHQADAEQVGEARRLFKIRAPSVSVRSCVTFQGKGPPHANSQMASADEHGAELTFIVSISNNDPNETVILVYYSAHWTRALG